MTGPGRSQVEAFVEAVSGLDIDGAARHLHSDVRLRWITPSGSGEDVGLEAVTARLRDFFDGVEPGDVLAADVHEVGDRWSFAYRLRVPGAVVAQHGVCDADDGGLEAIDLVCSGFRPDAAAAPGHVHHFDAGALGCTDGLAGEFRRRIRAIPVGDVLEIVARDPSAKADLPPLARMMGHTVLSTEAHDDGRLVFRMERGR